MWLALADIIRVVISFGLCLGLDMYLSLAVDVDKDRNSIRNRFFWFAFVSMMVGFISPIFLEIFFEGISWTVIVQYIFGFPFIYVLYYVSRWVLWKGINGKVMVVISNLIYSGFTIYYWIYLFLNMG